MLRPRVLASTTSHKREPLLATLEVFARLGLDDIDLNLRHIVEGGVPVLSVLNWISALGLRVWVVSGGWCDFYLDGAGLEQTFSSVARQVEIAHMLRVHQLRLFFGRLAYDDFTRPVLDHICSNLRRLADEHRAITFAFENHDGASLHPEVCAAILDGAGRPNIRMNFDPINFVKGGADPIAALDRLARFVGHVHLKGLDKGDYCEFGEGEVDLAPFVRALESHGYEGRFTVEYEGRFDGTLRLYRSVQRARAALGDSGTMTSPDRSG